MDKWPEGKCKNCGDLADNIIVCEKCGAVGCILCIGYAAAEKPRDGCKACGMMEIVRLFHGVPLGTRYHF